MPPVILLGVSYENKSFNEEPFLLVFVYGRFSSFVGNNISNSEDGSLVNYTKIAPSTPIISPINT